MNSIPTKQDDDPFACFGEGDDENDVVEASDDSSDRDRARRLVEDANARRHHASAGASEEEGMPIRARDEQRRADEVVESAESMQRRMQDLPWPDRPPLYLGAMNVRRAPSSVGGGRGYVAARDLPPGTLLLVEEAACLWPPEQLGKPLGLVSVRSILSTEHTLALLKDFELLHPTKANVDAVLSTEPVDGFDTTTKVQIVDMVSEMKKQHGSDPLLQDILRHAEASGITNGDGTPFIELDVYRVLLALRYNGFATGLYFHSSIFNHGDDPNCIKYMPGEDKDATNRGKGSSGRTLPRRYSEIRTTKYVMRGDSLTLHYIDPREVSHATRRLHLWDQHRFDIGDGSDLPGALREMELVSGHFPASSIGGRNEEREAFHVEKTMLEMEELLEEIKAGMRLDYDSVVQCFERAKALEMAAVELVNAATSKLGNKHHLLLVRCFRLHLDVAEVLVWTGEDQLSPPSSTEMNNAQRTNIMCRFVPTARNLLALQMKYLGEYHPDVARTYNDLAQSLEALLSWSPKRLFDLDLDGLDTFSKCSTEEHRCRREFQRISAFYPNNVDKYLP